MDGEIDLRQYLGILWRRRSMVAVTILIAVLLAALFSFLLPPVYEAQAIVLVDKPSFQTGAPPSPQNAGPQIGSVLVEEFPTETLAAFAKSKAVVQSLAQRVLGESAKPSKLEGSLSAQTVRNTNLVELKVRGNDSTRVARIANEWAALITARSEGLFSSRAEQTYIFFDRRLRDSKSRLGGAEEALRRFDSKSEAGVLHARVNALTNQIAAFDSRLTDLSVALERSETELNQTEAKIQQQQRILTLSKSITTDPFLNQAASEVADQKFLEISKLRLKNEELNPVYVNLDQSRVNLSVQVAALRAERARVVQALVQMNGELGVLQDRMAATDLERARLARSVDNTKQLYDVLLQRQEEAQIAAANQAGSVKLVAPAVVPDSPIGPRKILNMTLAFVLGLLAGSMLAFFRENLTVSAPARLAPSPAVVASVPRGGGEVKAGL